MHNIKPINQALAQEWSAFLVNDNEGVIRSIIKRAAEIHAETNQKYDDYLPYAFHLNMVCNVFMQFGSVCFDSREEMDEWGHVAIFGAAFHDTIEDARLSYNDVLKIAGEFFHQEEKRILAAEIVYALTNEKGRNRDERENDKYFEGIREVSFAPCIKLCDRYANAFFANARQSSLAKKYRVEMKTFLTKLLIVDERSVDSCSCLPEELGRLCDSYPLSQHQTTCLMDVVALAELKNQLDSEKESEKK